VIFGQRGNDWIQGDGSAIEDTGQVTVDVQATRESVEDWAGIGRDGDDYIEGNGDNDVIFGNLGQDDIVGDNSQMFSLDTVEERETVGTDTIFGGAGTRLARNNFGDLSDQGHARDADTIMGDNGDIFRLVGTNVTPLPGPAFLTFNYDWYDLSAADPLWIIPRAYTLLDYVQGIQSDPSVLGADDLIHGENGDDTIHGMTGNDVLFGEGQDDDIYGGTGFDRIYGGTGQDGILGDDGKLLTSRNGLTEPLNRLDAANDQTFIGIPGPWTGSVVFVENELQKVADLTAFNVPPEDDTYDKWNDTIYGGLGGDFIHAGEGDDAVSGAEAVNLFYNENPQLPNLNANPLGYHLEVTDPRDPEWRTFAAYDPENPRLKIENFLLNFDAFWVDELDNRIEINGEWVKSDDGKDRLFGDNGNDWIVGGTNFDRIFGGYGDDLMNADDNHETNGGLNNLPENPGVPDTDERFRDGDFVYGGAGLDVLIGNSGNDRLFDWTGEFNSYFVPFSPFGMPTVNRLFSPHARDFLRELAFATGVDPTQDMLDLWGVDVPIHLSEPFDEIALVEPEDNPLWQEQSGPPRDPQPGNIPGVRIDTRGGPELEWAPKLTPILRVEKAINAVDPTQPTPIEDADAGPGVILDVGENVTWTYLVSNMGNVTLTDVTLSDDFGTAANTGDDFTPVPILGTDGIHNIGDLDGDNELDPGETWRYTSDGVVAYQVVSGQYLNGATATAIVEGTAQPVVDRDPNHHFGSVGDDIRIEKAINAENPLAPTIAEDADTATGPVLPVGAPVVWTYLVTTIGTTPLSDIVVMDDNGTPGDSSDDFAPERIGGDLNGNSLLDPGEVWIYSSENVAPYEVVQGQYRNVARVSGILVDGDAVMDDDLNHHFGSVGLKIEKATNAVDPLNPTTAEDADAGPGRGLPVGDALVWTYLVSNVGFTPIENVIVIDDGGTPGETSDDFMPVSLETGGFNEGDLNQNGVLDPGETWRYTSSGAIDASSNAVPDMVEVGPYRNVATVTGENSDTGALLVDTDPSHYVGVGPEISVEKAINAVNPLKPSEFEDADSGSGLVPLLPIDSAVLWTYLVSNESLVPLADIEILDDAGTPNDPADDFIPVLQSGDDNGNGVLDPGETWLYTSVGAIDYVVTEGPYTNNVYVNSTVPSTGEGVTDSDTNNHEGVNGGVRLEKAINAIDPARPTTAEDADDPDDPFVLAVGEVVVWTYQVINETGQALTLVDQPIVDDAGTPDDPLDDFMPLPILGSNGSNVGDRNGNGKLDRNEVWLYTSAGVFDYAATEGLYRNVAQVEAQGRQNQRFHDDDLNYHLGVEPAVRIEKAINAEDPTNPTAEEDADNDAVLLAVGDDVVWTYLVSNEDINGLVIDSIVDDAGTPFDFSDDFTPAAVGDGFGFNIGDTNQDNVLDVGEVWQYTSEGVISYQAVAGPYENRVKVQASDATTGIAATPDVDTNNHFGGQATLRIEKAINADDRLNPTPYEDADFATGPILTVGTEVIWTYLVTNEGNVSIDFIGLVDDFGTDDRTDDFFPMPIDNGVTYVGDDNENGILDPGETWLFSSEGQLDKNDPRVNTDGNYVVVEGQYTNLAGVTAFGVDMVSFDDVIDTDPNNHYGTPGGPGVVNVEKSITTVVQGQAWSVSDVDADTVPVAVVVPEGEEVFWTYRVTNDGGSPLTINSLIDNAGTHGTTGDDFTPAPVLEGGFNLGDLNQDTIFDPGETWIYTSQGAVTYLAAAGLYENVAVVIATDGQQEYRDDDLNYHFGSDPSVTVEKALNAIDPFNPTSVADSDFLPGSEILVGTELIWTYQVENTGNIAINITSLVDDAGTPSDPNDDFTPAPILGSNGTHNIGDLDGDSELDPGETWLFTSVGVESVQAKLGQYGNTAEVFAVEPETEEEVSDDDLNYHFGTDTAEGLTPGFWKQNADQFNGTQWPRGADGGLVYPLFTKIGEVFDVPVDEGGEPVYPIAFTSFTEALNFEGGGVFALMRHAVAALLNSTHMQVAYPLSPSDIVTLTNAALASGDPTEIESLKDEFDAFNNIGGELGQQVAKINANDADVFENDGSVFIRLTLSEVQDAPVTVSYQTVEGTATAGEDYVDASGAVTFDPGVTEVFIEIPLIDDGLYEGEERFNIELISPVGAQIGRNPGRVTINDDDPEPELNVAANDAQAAEEGTDPAEFTVTRGANMSGEVSVTVSIGGTSGASDYTLSVATGGTWNALSNLLTLPNGIDSAVFTVTPIDDADDEIDESVLLTLSNPNGAKLGASAQATAMITDNDDPPPTPVLDILATDSNAAEEGTDPAVFTVTRSVNSSGAVSVTVSFGGDAVASDYSVLVDSTGGVTYSAGVLTLPDGVGTATITVTPVDDSEDEADEIVTLTLTSPSGADLGTSTQANATITDNDDPPPPPPSTTPHQYDNTESVGIPDQSTITSTIEIPDVYTIQDINVVVNISHNTVQDLDVYLVSASGTRIELFTDVGGGGDNFIDTELDDAAATSIVDASAPFTGVFRPEGDLSLLEGEDVNGTWTLEITDDKRRRSGTLNSWSLIVTESAALSADTVAPSDATATVLNTADLQPIVDEAIRRWISSGLINDAQASMLRDIDFVIADLSPGVLAQSTTDTIFIDDDAAGFGWFIDSTPSDDVEFIEPATSGDSSVRMDLLSAVMHEMGHIIGFDHEESGILDDTLSPGERLQFTGEHDDADDHLGLMVESGDVDRFAGRLLMTDVSGGKNIGFGYENALEASEYEESGADAAVYSYGKNDQRTAASIPQTTRLHLIDWIREFLPATLR
jgi:subtilisin-like proprotein convertase family protein